MPRDTRTGGVLEAAVLPALKQGGYDSVQSVDVGLRLGGGRHRIDVLAHKADEKILISLKWQQTSGTAEQKIPFEVICLIDAVQNSGGEFSRAYLVLGGHGWKLRTFYITGGLRQYIQYDEHVHIRDMETFIAEANKGRL
jgi:hypothetical protein